MICRVLSRFLCSSNFAHRTFSSSRSRISLDVQTLFHINNNNRNANTSDDNLLLLQELEYFATQHPTYMFPVPTFASSDWTPHSGFVPTQEEYNNLFEAYFPRAMHVLKNVSNVVVAGGAAGAPFLSPQPVGDVDFFVHGLDANNEQGLWAKAKEVAEVLQISLKGTTAVAPGVITFRFLPADQLGSSGGGNNSEDEGIESRRRVDRTIQLILRAYPSTSSLIHAFDIPSSAIAFDGEKTYLTALGAYAQAYKVNLVNLDYRSTTFEKRLVKYFKRGFALGIPNFDLSSLTSTYYQKTQVIDMPYLKINPLFVRGNFVATQTIRSKKTILVGGKKLVTPISDYSPSNHSFVESLFNFSQLIRGSDTLIAKDSHPNVVPDHNVLGRQIPISAKEVMDGKVLTKGDLLPRALFNECLKTVCEEASEKDIKPAFLRKYLAMTKQAADYFVERRVHLQDIVQEQFSFDKELTMRPTVMKLVSELTKRYEQFANQPLEWWIKSDPGRQWTASRNPVVSDPRTWFSAKYYLPPDQTSEATESAAYMAQLWFRSRETIQSRTGLTQEEDWENFAEKLKRSSEPGRKSHKKQEEVVYPSEADLVAETRTVKSSVEVDIDWKKFDGEVLEDLP